MYEWRTQQKVKNYQGSIIRSAHWLNNILSPLFCCRRFDYLAGCGCWYLHTYSVAHDHILTYFSSLSTIKIEIYQATLAGIIRLRRLLDYWCHWSSSVVVTIYLSTQTAWVKVNKEHKREMHIKAWRGNEGKVWDWLSHVCWRGGSILVKRSKECM